MPTNHGSSATTDIRADNHKHISDYVNKIRSKISTGHASEHTFRIELEDLIINLAPDVLVTNEPIQVTDCGNPDLLISKKDIPIGFIEAKAVGKNLNSRLYTEQFDRYKAALDNLIITDYTYFRFYEYGTLIDEVSIARISNKDAYYSQVSLFEEDYSDDIDRFIGLMQKFCNYEGQTIKSASRLAEMMAGKARLLESTLCKALNQDIKNDKKSELRSQFNGFKSVLIHDLTPSAFADIYAQTLAYGMFAARLHDDNLTIFSRQKAAENIPKTNPFLRKLFSHVAGVDIDERIKTNVDNLADVFRATDVATMLKNFGKTTQTQDPMIHFYETFLKKYDPDLRQKAGVYYTPKPIVQFIVRAVDNILKSDFGLTDGIADTQKIKIKQRTQTQDNRTTLGYKTVSKEVHKVQILDPATGTGTFLAAIIYYIYENQYQSMPGAWSSYVDQDLLPRLHGFELLMASYAIAHLKIDMLLSETKYQPTQPKRHQIYLTNSLEEHHPDTDTIFSGWLSTEANEANAIKRDAPVMVVMGNPPYSVSSNNKGEWIQDLIADYKKNLNEKKINLDDDYIKFIRYGQHYIEKNGEGVLAFITNNSFVNGITHRQMRKSLMQTFDKIYILDLNGFSKLKNGDLVDENVFDIMQGVSINIFVKTSNSNEKLLKYKSITGKKSEKYKFLDSNSINTVDWEDIETEEPYYFFSPRDFKNKNVYEQSFELKSMFKVSNSGIKTDRDSLFYDDNKDVIRDRFYNLLNEDFDTNFAKKFNVKDSGSYKITSVIKDKTYNEKNISACTYRPFEDKFIYYTQGIISRPAYKVIKHIENHDNQCLVIGRQGQVIGNMPWNLVFTTDKLVDYNVFYRGGGYVFPLYQYPDSEEKDNQTELLEIENNGIPTRTPNLDLEIVANIAKAVSLIFTNEKSDTDGTFAPIDILDYIYAVLHSSVYRETYKEFLKIDFPRIPYPNDADNFWQLVELGRELRQIHLLKSPRLVSHIKTLNLRYPIDGDNSVTRKLTATSGDFEHDNNDETIGKVWINDNQHFTNVPLMAWEFYIGGYQPAQKWLKDRRDRMLDHKDIQHYINIIASLSLTIELMQQIDKVDVV